MCVNSSFYRRMWKKKGWAVTYLGEVKRCRERNICVDYIIFRKRILMSQTFINKDPCFSHNIMVWISNFTHMSIFAPYIQLCVVLHCDIYWYLSNISYPILGNVFNVWCHVVLHVFYQVVLESNMLFSGECPKGAHIVPLLQFCFSFSTVTLVTTNLKTLWAHIHTFVCVLLTFSDGYGEKTVTVQKLKQQKAALCGHPKRNSTVCYDRLL